MKVTIAVITTINGDHDNDNNNNNVNDNNNNSNNNSNERKMMKTRPCVQMPPPPPAGRRLEDLYTLAAHYSAQPAERLTGYAQIVRLWAEYVGYSESSPPPEDEMRAGDLLHTLCRLACNCHTITDPDLRAVGVGIFPLAALVNHSCR